MSTFTSSLPDDLIKMLGEQAKKLKVPKNQLIEKALRVYLHQLKRLEYIQSYQKSQEDPNLLTLAEEGMADYLKQLENEEG